MACGRGSSDRRSLADWVELPVGDPRVNGLAHGLTGQHSLDLSAPSGGLFALRRSYEPQRLPVHQNGTPPPPHHAARELRRQPPRQASAPGPHPPSQRRPRSRFPARSGGRLIVASILRKKRCQPSTYATHAVVRHRWVAQQPINPWPSATAKSRMGRVPATARFSSPSRTDDQRHARRFIEFLPFPYSKALETIQAPVLLPFRGVIGSILYHKSDMRIPSVFP